MDANSRPAVTPKLSELPADPGKRDAILDQANDTHGPEGTPKLSGRQHKVETQAAFLAAIIGSAFSKTENVTLGTATIIDENDLGPGTSRTRAQGSSVVNTNPAAPGETPPPAATPPAETSPPPGQLLPWIKLH